MNYLKQVYFNFYAKEENIVMETKILQRHLKLRWFGELNNSLNHPQTNHQVRRERNKALIPPTKYIYHIKFDGHAFTSQ